MYGIGFGRASGVTADVLVNLPVTMRVVPTVLEYANIQLSVPGSTAATITADSGTGGSGTLYRGIVFYVPVGSNINDFLIDTNVAITATGGTIGTVSVQIGNAFNDTTYGSITSANASAARNTIVQTGAELLATNSTTVDFTNPNGVLEPATFSQVVVTFTIPYTGGSGTTLPTITAGTFTAAVRYTQLDTNIGTATAYPYGNFD